MIAQDGAAGPSTQLSRQQILHATALCLRRDGYDATTIRRIAGELSCSVGSIYRYFTDKRELLLAVTQDAFEPVAAAAENGGDLEASLRQYHATAAADPSLYRLMFWLAVMAQGPTAAAPEREVRKGVLPPVIGRTIAAWSALLGDERRAQRYWAALHGGIMLGVNASEAAGMARAAVASSGMEVRDVVPDVSIESPVPPVELAAIRAEGNDAFRPRGVPEPQPQPQIVVDVASPCSPTPELQLAAASLP